ncbi:hypothetical protein BTVI_82615 [Pitangus sulphuratus]|nr:hypothetical protein BTVI_82615 [Pitangus sulphuratus]
MQVNYSRRKAIISIAVNKMSHKEFTRECAKEGYEDGEGSKGEAIQAMAEITWFVQPGEEDTEGRPRCSCSFFTKGVGGAGTDPFSVVTSDRTQGNGLKLCQRRFRLSIRKNLYYLEGGWALEQALQESGQSTNLTEFKKLLDNALRHMIGFSGYLVQGHELDFNEPFNSGYSMIF